MRNYTFLLIGFLLFACNDGELNPLDEKLDVLQINGTWQLSESSYSIGDGVQHWQPVNNGYSYTFKADSTFLSNRFEHCDGGTYSITNNRLTLDFNCEGADKVYIENFQLKEGALFLSPVSPIICIEGCSFKFIKSSE